MTMVTRLQNQINKKASKLMLCGFGVGLSWGTVYLETTNDFTIVDLVEY
jgi:3-oxoacyl-[acyl-carrier-protein] synthase-3